MTACSTGSQYRGSSPQFDSVSRVDDESTARRVQRCLVYAHPIERTARLALALRDQRFAPLRDGGFLDA
jgi:hypothetical protein